MFTPSAADKINEFKIGYSRYVVRAVQNFAGQPLSRSNSASLAFLIPRTHRPPGGLPCFQFSSLSSLGSTDWFPEYLNENNYQYMDAFTYVHGRHPFKMGADVRRRLHGFFQTQNQRGDLCRSTSCSLRTSQLIREEVRSRVSLMSYPTRRTATAKRDPFGMRWTEFSAYLMDDFRLLPN